MKNKGKFARNLLWHGLCITYILSVVRKLETYTRERVMKRLLIVDDDPDRPLILRTRFEARGYECEEAEDGRVAHRFFSRKVLL
jgi:hypothetical protein